MAVMDDSMTGVNSVMVWTMTAEQKLALSSYFRAKFFYPVYQPKVDIYYPPAFTTAY
jgi:hypothetical protein